MPKQIILSKTVWNQIYINSCKQYGSWSAGFSWKQCRSRSAGFFRSQLIRIHTVFNARCELIILNQNMKYIIVLTLYILLVQEQVNRNIRLVLNEMGPGRTSRAWYFHSPVYVMGTQNPFYWDNSFRHLNHMPRLLDIEDITRELMFN